MNEYKRKIRRISAAMVLLALLVRLVTATGLGRLGAAAVEHVLETPAAAGMLFYLELGQAVPLPPALSQEPAEPSEEDGEADPTDTPPDKPPAEPAPSEAETPSPAEEAEEPAQEAPQETPLTFTEADAQAVTIGGACSYTVDKLALLQQESKLDFDQDGPTVLIVHTHTSEAYTMEAGWEYEGDTTARTQDPDYSVVRVGRVLAETLEAHGISVIHDESFNDYPSYSGAYNRTLEKIEAWVAEYPSIQMVIDVHRDAAANADGSPVRHAVTLQGVETAQLMLVMGTDEGGLSHPGWQDNLSWALKLQAVLERMYPGLCRNLDLRTERFNQHMTPGSMLVEVGSSGNTLKEALAAAEDLGEGLAALIAGT